MYKCYHYICYNKHLIKLNVYEIKYQVPLQLANSDLDLYIYIYIYIHTANEYSSPENYFKCKTLTNLIIATPSPSTMTTVYLVYETLGDDRSHIACGVQKTDEGEGKVRCIQVHAIRQYLVNCFNST